MDSEKDNIVYIFLHLQRTGGTTVNGQIYKHLKPEEEFIHVGSPWLTEEQRKEIIPFEQRSLEERKKARVISGHGAYYGIHKLVPGKTIRYFTFVRDPAERVVSYYNGVYWGRTKKIPSFLEWYNVRRKNEMVHFYNSKFKGLKETAPTPSFLLRLNEKVPGGEKRVFWLKSIFKKFNYFKLKNKAYEELENAKKLLDLCWFVGELTQDQDIAFIFKSIGIPCEKWERYALSGDTKTKQINPLQRKIKKRFILDDETRKLIYKENPFDFKLYKYALELNKKHKR